MTDYSFACLCPVYGTPPHLLEECIQCFVDQTYPHRSLIIYDDLGTLDPLMRLPHGVYILTMKKRSPTLNMKYQYLSSFNVFNCDATAYAIWEVDDIYLPNHLEEHNRVLNEHAFSYPSHVYSTCPGKPTLEATWGNLFASCAIRADELHKCGGFVTLPRADSDLQSIAKFKTLGYGSPKPTYIFRWQDTDAPHGQASMKSPCDETWYVNYKPFWTAPITKLTPGYRTKTAAMLKKFYEEQEKP